MAVKKKASDKKVEQASGGTQRKVAKSTRKPRITHTACMYFARNVKLALRTTGKSETEFATQLKVKQPYLNRLLNGHNQPVLSTAILISEALGISLDVLISPQVELLQDVLRKQQAAKKSEEIRRNALAS